MKKYSIRQAVLDAIDETDDSIARHMNTLLKWAKYCEKAIGSLNGYPVKTGLATVLDHCIVLPQDCYKVLQLIHGDYSDDISIRYADMRSTVVTVEDLADENDLEYVWQDLAYPTSVSKVLWEEIGGELMLADGYEGEAMTLIYCFIQMDPKGYWLVNESHLDAIKKYLIYQISKKYLYKAYRSSKLTRVVDMQVVETYRRDYSVAIRNARALDNAENPIDSLG